MLNLRLHCFGHIHAEYGIRSEAETQYINASIVGTGASALKKPIEIVLDN
jgi:hypothetical protein